METNSLKSATICAVKDHAACELGGEAVILQMSTGTYYGLNHVGSRIWQTIQQQPCAFDAIVSSVIQQYDVDRQQVEDDVDNLLRSMLAEGLIQVHDANAP